MSSAGTGGASAREGERSVELALGDFAAALQWRDVPPPVQTLVEDVLLDALANGIVGCRAEKAADMASVLAAVDGPGDAGVLGSGRRLSLLGAVGQNAFQITAYTMCDVYRPALCHITPEVVPAVLGAAAGAGASGEDLLAAVAAGLEVTARIGRGLGYAAFRQRGFHTPGMIGSIGAAAAASRARGLDAERTYRAMGLAGAHAAGTFAGLGSDAIKVHQVHGARSAVLGTYLASAEFRGAANVLTAPDGGLLAAYSDGGTPVSITEGLGADWELMKLTLRARPGSSSVQSVGECALEHAVRLGPVRGSRLREVRVRVPPSAQAMCAASAWTDQLGALQSAPFLVAALLAGHDWWVELFEPPLREDPELAATAQRVEVVPDPSVPAGGAAVTVDVGGIETEASRPCALGDPGDPITRSMVEEKLRRACRSVAEGPDPDAVLDAVRGLATGTGCGALLVTLGLEGS